MFGKLEFCSYSDMTVLHFYFLLGKPLLQICLFELCYKLQKEEVSKKLLLSGKNLKSYSSMIA